MGPQIDELLAEPAKSEWTDYSIEFCGGTHLSNSSEVGAFRIVAEEGVAAGVRRIVAVTGDAAREAIHAAAPLYERCAVVRQCAHSATCAESVALVDAEISKMRSALMAAKVAVQDTAALEGQLDAIFQVLKKARKVLDAQAALRLKARVEEAVVAAAAAAASAESGGSGGGVVVLDAGCTFDGKALLKAYKDAKSKAGHSCPVPLMVLARSDARGTVSFFTLVPQALVEAKDGAEAVSAAAWPLRWSGRRRLARTGR